MTYNLKLTFIFDQAVHVRKTKIRLCVNCSCILSVTNSYQCDTLIMQQSLISLAFLLPCSSDSHLEGAVVEVIDHHLLEREPSPSCPITVDTVGSCATLVSEIILQKAPQVLDQQVAQMLYGN